MGAPRVMLHPDTRAEFFIDVLSDFPNLDYALLEDFLAYKHAGILPSYFGRDAPYVEPVAAYNAHLMHIHLKFPPDRFPENLPQLDRTCRRNQPHKDAALVYVQAELDENSYCVLGVLHPDGHAKARSDQIMRRLARLAQKFRDEN